ncbi:MAG: hypothetical protein ACK53Y_09105, partial [bacterium]
LQDCLVDIVQPPKFPNIQGPHGPSRVCEHRPTTDVQCGFPCRIQAPTVHGATIKPQHPICILLLLIWSSGCPKPGWQTRRLIDVVPNPPLNPSMRLGSGKRVVRPGLPPSVQSASHQTVPGLYLVPPFGFIGR